MYIWQKKHTSDRYILDVYLGGFGDIRVQRETPIMIDEDKIVWIHGLRKNFKKNNKNIKYTSISFDVASLKKNGVASLKHGAAFSTNFTLI